MRSNMPVTNIEYVLKDTETVVSKTDMQGNITYINRDFVNISGFSEEELLGAPQNIVRHPDMPVEAFADFWRTIKSGKAWTGLVKNRCKNGDHYWVEAHAAPLIENNKIVGYTSIRVKPSRDQIKAAENAYRAIKAGDKNLIIREGNAVRDSLLEKFKVLGNISIKAKLTLASISVASLFIIIGILAWFSATADNQQFTNWLMAISALGVPLAAVFGFLSYRSVVMPLDRIKWDIDRMSAGDLSGKIESHGNDEITGVIQALRVLQTNVKLLVGQIKEATDHVNLGASEIASGNADLSGRTESQASSLEETASSMEELTSTVKQNAEHARHANQLVVSTADIALKGGEVVEQVVTTMASIKASSRKISDIIGVIDGIAFQTNILALNAAVEAARAGEQGRGFAVVAAEVRNLAQRSAGAAKEIKTLIGDSVEKVDAGSKLVDQAGEAMGDIVTSVELVTDIMSGIATASQQQSAGIEQVNQAVGQMDEMTQQNAALVEQASAAAESLQDQAVMLAQLVGAFKLVSGAQASYIPVLRDTAKSRPVAAKSKAALAGMAGKPKRLAVVGGREE
ncbi:MAG: methyl-accepting chemotaxis protein [Sulfuriferula sp.]